MKAFLSVQLLVLAIFLAVLPRSADAAAVEHLEPRAKYCTASSQCNQELNHFCNYNRCAKKRPNGAFCYKNNGCWSGLCWQERSVCISAVNPRPLLAPCTASTQCETGNCKYKRCAKKVKNGRNCYKDANCRSGHCNKDAGKCQASHTAPTTSSGAATILPTAQPESSSTASSTDVNTVLPTGVSSDLSSASSSVSSVIASATSELSSQIASATSEAASATSEAASEASSVIASATSELSSQAASATSEAEASATSAASDAEASATSAASDAEASATSAASDAEASATSAASDAEASATSAASDAEASASSTASEAEASATSEVAGAASSVAETDPLPTEV